MEEKPERRIYLKQFRSISHAISTYEDLSVLISHIVEGISRSFNVRGCSIMLLDDREKQLFRVETYGISDKYLDKGPLPVDESDAFVTGEPVFIKDMSNDPRVRYPEEAKKEGLISMLSVPIKSRGAVTGIIRIYNDESWTLHEDDVDSFCVLAEHLGLVIECNGLKNFLDHVRSAIGNLPLRMLEEF